MSLMQRLQEAEGSRELDVAVCREAFGYDKTVPMWHCLEYTTSIDAALTLPGAEDVAALVFEWLRVNGWWAGKLQGVLARRFCIEVLKARESDALSHSHIERNSGA